MRGYEGTLKTFGLTFVHTCQVSGHHGFLTKHGRESVCLSVCLKARHREDPLPISTCHNTQGPQSFRVSSHGPSERLPLPSPESDCGGSRLAAAEACLMCLPVSLGLEVLAIVPRTFCVPNVCATPQGSVSSPVVDKSPQRKMVQASHEGPEPKWFWAFVSQQRQSPSDSIGSR